MGFEELKAKQSVVWGTGPYQRITETISDIHEVVVERLAPAPGDNWLDLACGTGAVAERAASAGANVTGIDLAPALIATAQERAGELGLEIDYRVGDAESLELADASFDKVSSTCGVMFTPDHEATAGELARVTRPGGRIALANWTPTGGPGQDVRGHGPLSACPAAEQPICLGWRGARPRFARRGVRARAQRARVHAAGGLRRGVLGALLHELRPDEDARGLARRAARGAPPRLGGVLRAELPRRRRDRPHAGVPARARNADDSREGLAGRNPSCAPSIW